VLTYGSLTGAVDSGSLGRSYCLSEEFLNHMNHL
jgi:hypothetical protein